MIRTSVLTFAFALAALAIPPQALANPSGGGNGSISGMAQNGTQVRVRDLGSQQVAGSTTVSSDGSFSVAGLPEGAYLVEVLNARGQVIGAGNVESLLSGNMNLNNVTVTTSPGALSPKRVGQGFIAEPGSKVALVNIAGNVVAVTIQHGRGHASPSQ